MKLYFSKGACSLAVRIIINELDLKVDYESVNLKTKKTETNADYLKINPKGAVPCLILDNNEVLTENVVIQQYLAEKQNAVELLPAIGDFNRYRVLEWMIFISTDIHKTYSPLFNPDLPQNVKDEIFIPLLKKKFNYIEKYFGTRKYLLGPTFTLADSYLFVMLFWLPHFKLSLSEWPNLSRYYDDLIKRKSIAKSLAEENFKVD